MYTRRRIALPQVFHWTRQIVPVIFAWSTVVTAAHILAGWEWLRLPALPVTILGTAVSFYLGFEGNAAYNRLWEARKIWGGIVNASRSWGALVTTAVDGGEGSEPTRTELVHRHLAWLAALRIQLRRRRPWEHSHAWYQRIRESLGTLDTSSERMGRLLRGYLCEEEVRYLMDRTNPATQLVQCQFRKVRELLAQGRVNDFRYLELTRVLDELYVLQGKCERIKNFPLPRQYATASHWIVNIFVALLPFALLESLHHVAPTDRYVWLTVPSSVVVAWVFYFWDRVVDYTENPFEGLMNDIPMDALSRTIEIDLREMLGEHALPPALRAVDHDVLV